MRNHVLPATCSTFTCSLCHVSQIKILSLRESIHDTATVKDYIALHIKLSINTRNQKGNFRINGCKQLWIPQTCSTRGRTSTNRLSLILPPGPMRCQFQMEDCQPLIGPSFLSHKLQSKYLYSSLCLSYFGVYSLQILQPPLCFQAETESAEIRASRLQKISPFFHLDRVLLLNLKLGFLQFSDFAISGVFSINLSAT